MIDAKLITFINVVQLKNFTRAAEVLNLTQPAVTQHIKLLEEYYGVNLIKKKGRQFFLTEEGEILFQYAKELKVSAALIERKLRNQSAVAKQYVIGATLTIGEFVLPPLLGEYKKLHENIDIIMQVSNMNGITNKLMNGEIDLAIVEGPFDRSKFKYKKFKDDELVLVVSSESDFAKRLSIGLDEIINGHLILREKGSSTRAVFENKLTEKGYNLAELKTYMEIGSIGAIKSLVKANLGYTIISKIAIKQEVENGILHIIPIDGVKIMREFNFLYVNHSPEDFIDSFICFLTH